MKNIKEKWEEDDWEWRSSIYNLNPHSSDGNAVIYESKFHSVQIHQLKNSKHLISLDLIIIEDGHDQGMLSKYNSLIVRM